ncbi:MAG: YaeQ family protein [Porticoccaceae bacterium]|nr:YaeQ family protein [Porticoccaceae bacterium]
MAINSRVCKADLNITDMDRGYYVQHQLTVAQHPSETDQRLMLRLLAYALHANDTLQFGGGLSTDDEPDLWEKNLHGNVALWIDLGTPSEKRIRKACSQSQAVSLYVYGDSAVDQWWQQIRRQVQRFDHLSIWQVPDSASISMADSAARSMGIQVTIQDAEISWYSEQSSIDFCCRRLL